jgi:nitrogen-specific signal transduction histidine kinase
MDDHHIRIALISNSPSKIELLGNLLKDAQTKISTYSFKQALQNAIVEDPADLVVVDCASQHNFDYRNFEPIRLQKKFDKIPFIFIIDTGQDLLKRQLYKKSNNFMLVEPLDRFIIISLMNNALYLGKIDRRLQLYHEMIEGERKLIQHLDELLDVEKIASFETEQDLLQYLQLDFVQRIELTTAVETALFAFYEKERNSIVINIFDREHKRLIRKHSLNLINSSADAAMRDSMVRIFETNKLADPFVQALEESIGFKISGLLLIPITAFHDTQNAIILINKLYRRDFTETDLAFGLLAAQIISRRLENLSLQKLNNASDRELPQPFSRFTALVRDNQFYRQLLASVNFGTIIFTNEFAVRYVNRSARLILKHMTNEEPVSRLDEMFNEDEFQQLTKIFHSSEFPVIRQEIQLRRANMPDYFIGFSIYPFETEGPEQKYILIFSEISQTKRIQAEIIRMDRMASLGILSSGIAHEIRNPLAGIKAMAQSLEDEIEVDSPQVEYVQRILRQVNRLDDLLRAFFTYAKPQRPDPTTCHIQKIIQEVIPLVHNKLIEKKIKVEQHFAQNLSPIFVDANQIEQVFLNLFLNAIDAMSGGGKLIIEAQSSILPQPFLDRRKRMPGLFSNKYIEIHVSDTGSGISGDILDKIYNPFFTTKSNGTGLGLSIVYQIIKEHGGEIDVKSDVSKGTRFIIQLPTINEPTVDDTEE